MTGPRTSPDGAAQLLSRLARKGGSGIIVATRGKLKRLICVDQGAIVHAASNLIEEQFGEFLLHRRVLTKGQHAEAQLEAQSNGKKVTTIVAQRRFLSQKRLLQELEEHTRSLVSSTLEWREGEFRLERGQPRLDDEIPVRLEVAPLILEHVRQHPTSIDAVRVRIGPPDLRPVVSQKTKTLLEHVPLGSAAKFLLETCDGELELNELVARCTAPSHETLRAIYGMLLLGVLRPTTEDPRAKLVREEVTREECLARLRQAEDADYYSILGVEEKADLAQVRKAYYLLARRFHPDRFRSGPLQDLRERVEAYFAMVTEAHNTLQDPERRAQYDEERMARVLKKTKEPEQDTTYLARQNFLRAKALIERKSYQQALTFLENAVQLDGSQYPYHLELGQILSRNPRRRDEAERCFEKVLELNPTVVEAYYQLGLLCRKGERDDEAVERFREVLRWEPGHVDAAAQLREMGLDPDSVVGSGGIFRG